MDFRSEAEEEEQSLRASGSQRGPARRETRGLRICTSNPGGGDPTDPVFYLAVRLEQQPRLVDFPMVVLIN
ncbi:hypothetical protein EYF80_028894 [Liparis tanakae]|uniref:Uncharacterized protein n=1 Tax=Liparis tanakae TaxID=230148 RepID=A0A4Z2H549_9TELE|nr:hypothetical protein EYF80_028894 [Liparis tanakae]